MKWLLKRFQKPRPDPLASLRQEPTEDERMALVLERYELDRLDALRQGEHWLSAWSNVGSGRGYALESLVRSGLMQCERVQGPAEYHYRYWPTAAGRAYLAEHA